MKTLPFYYILTIEEEKSISKAAKKLEISQPALSAYIAKLEAKLGESLFDRSKNPVELTEIGKIYYDYVKNAKQLEMTFEQQVADQNGLGKGSLVIGGANSFTIGFLPRTTADFLEKYPAINIRIVDAKVPELVNMALDNELDFFITGYGIDETDLLLEPLLKERLFLCVPQQWKINEELKEYQVPYEDIFSGISFNKQYKDIPLDLLYECPFILLEKDLRVRNIADQLFADFNFSPKQTILVGQIMTSLALTAAGNGISFISDYIIRHGNLKDLPCIYSFDKKLSIRELAVAYKKNKYMTKASKEYISMLREHYRKDIP